MAFQLFHLTQHFIVSLACAFEEIVIFIEIIIIGVGGGRRVFGIFMTDVIASTL